MSHLANTIDSRLQQTRSRMLWMVLGALVAGQLFAFWLLCTHQVRLAEARSNEVLMQQLALSDCLQYVPGSTIGSCNVRVERAQALRPVDVPTMTGAVPVSFNAR